MKRLVLAGMLATAVALVGFAANVSADSAVSHYTFYNCTGPGVPSTFVAVKTALPDSASHPVSAAGAFRVVDSTDVYTVNDFGSGAPHGITQSGHDTDWCWVNFAGIGPTLVGGVYHGG